MKTITPYKRIEDYIAAHPGQTCTQIAKALDVRADSLSSRLNQWRRALIVRAEWTVGQTPGRKAWRYYPRLTTEPALLLLAFRETHGCAQYPFDSFAAFKAWASRPPYVAERLRVQIYRERSHAFDTAGYLGAAEAVAAIARQLGVSESS